MKILRILVVLVIFLQLLGCAKTLSMDPQYNPETKVLWISGLTFNNVTYYNKKENRIEGNPRVILDIETFKIEDSVCPTFRVVRQKLGNEGYFLYSMKEQLMMRHNDACLTRRINNVNSLRCQDDSMSNPKFYLSSSTKTNRGYGRRTIYYFTTDDCLKKFESHYLKLSNTKDVGSYNSNKLSTHYEEPLHGTDVSGTDITGTYVSDIRGSLTDMVNRKLKITLKQSGKDIIGTNVKQKKIVTGTRKEDTIKFKYHGRYGDLKGEWKINSDGTKLEGTWESIKESGKWNLTRIE